MKKLIIIIGLLIPLIVGAQSKKVTELDYDTDVDNADILYSIDDGTTSKQMRMDTLLATVKDSVNALQSIMNDSLSDHITKIAAGSVGWAISDDNVYLDSSDDSVGLGTSTPSQKLDVNGRMNVSGCIYVRDSIIYGNSDLDPKIYPSGAYGMYLYFKDNSGTYDLSSLGSAGVNSGSGITIDGANNIDLYGSLTENADITTTGYSFNIHNPTGGTDNKLYLSGANTSAHGNILSLKGYSNFNIQSDSIRLYWNTTSDRFRIQDSRTGSNVRGLEYASDYSLNITADDLRSIVDIGTTFGIMRDTLGSIFFTTDTIYSPAATVTLDDNFMITGGLFFYDGDDYITGSDGTLDFYIADGEELEIDATDGVDVKNELTVRDTVIIDLITEHGGTAGDVDLSDQTDNAFLFEDNDTICSTDDVLISANYDTLDFFGWDLYKDGSNSWMFRYNNIDIFRVLTTGYFGGAVANAPMMYYGSGYTSPDTPGFSWQGDDNTGWAHPIADRIKGMCGGDSVIIFDKDSIWLPELVPSDTAALILTPSGKIDTAELGEVADWVFETDIGKFEDYRIYWDENHKLKDIQVSGNPYRYINSVVASLEKNFLWDKQERDIIEVLEVSIRRLKIEYAELERKYEDLERRVRDLENRTYVYPINHRH